jgi:hypothetical protein
MLILFSGSSLWAIEAIGVIKNVKGTAFIKRGEERLSANPGGKLLQGDTITTTEGASLGIILRDNGILSMGPDTRLTVEEYEFRPAEKKLGMISTVFKGTLVYLSGAIAKLKKNSIFFKTPTATCGIRGTQIAIKVSK